MGKESLKLSTNEIIDIITNFEDKENIFSKKIEGVYFYKLIRVELYNKILSTLFKTKEPHDATKNGIIVFNFLKAFLPNLLKRKKKLDVLLFDNDRVFIDGEKKRSIYLYEIIDKFKEKNVLFGVVYPWVMPNENREFEAPPTFKYFLQYIFLTLKLKINKKSNFQKLNKIEIELIERYNKELCTLLGINPILKLFDNSEIKREIEKFKMQYSYYYYHFKKKHIKEIYIVCAYGKEGIIAAAKDLNIKVVELQHGAITKYHLAYHYPVNQEIPYFPDYFYSFGKYWEEIVSFPKGIKIKTCGFPYLEKQLMKYKNMLKKKDQILFISQGHIGEKLLYKAIEFALQNKNKNIVYRLHPGELRYSLKNYINILQNYTLNNFILEECKQDLYKLMKESEYIFAVSSTAIYEALALKKDVGIISLPSYEEVIDLIKQRYVDFYQEDKFEKIEKTSIKNQQFNKFFNIEMEEKNVKW
ncbi:hypothetical protein IX329_002381 [Fusobacterium necrophorum]|nr:capsular biosynthesis protein [Fusobacterium necrophorum]MBR8734766.1 hypothetical protein [Fusobacterium necrophorum]MBR8790942.1 hypothetical protein [Fusobacterium necrophorum]